MPEDWWELTAKVAETLQDMGRWCRTTGHRWIWVLDGLDRLAEEDQQALPWLPLLIPEGVSVMISSLDCPAKAILQERRFQLLEIGPLQRVEQEQLIETYLERYTKKLDAGRVEQILACELTRSPLFLRVLLEELRQCGRFETLEAQIGDYIKPNADGNLAMSDLYSRVLARLENDCGPEPVRKAITALWASRAGLSEPELLAITDLAPLQWAEIDLALDQAFGRNGNRLVFDHDYLRHAVEDHYLHSKKARQKAHRHLAAWFDSKEKWDARKAEELPWQLQRGQQIQALRDLLLCGSSLYELARERQPREVISYWQAIKTDSDYEIDELIIGSIEMEVKKRVEDPNEPYSYFDRIIYLERIAEILDTAGLRRELLLHLKTLALESIVRLLGPEHPDSLARVNSLGVHHHQKGDYEQAEVYYSNCLENRERLLGPDHPDTLNTVRNLGNLFKDKGNYEQAHTHLIRCLEGRERLLGRPWKTQADCARIGV